MQVLKTDLPWETLGALPEMLQTAWGALFTSLQLKKGDRLLVRGGTTSVGLAAAAIAKDSGATVISTTRREDRAAVLRAAGADQVVHHPCPFSHLAAHSMLSCRLLVAADEMRFFL